MTPGSAAPGQRAGEEFTATLEAEMGKQERKAAPGHRVHVKEHWEMQLEGRVETRWCGTFTATSNISKLGIHPGGGGSQGGPRSSRRCEQSRSVRRVIQQYCACARLSQSTQAKG